MTNKIENMRKSHELSKAIAKEMNEVNHNTFTEWELKGIIREYDYMLLTDNKQDIIEMLENEVLNGNEDALPLYKRVLTF